MRHKSSWLALLLAILLSVTVTFAQDSCIAFVDAALAHVGDNCDGLDRNSACYGYNRVNAQFIDAAAVANFSVPADRTGLDTLQEIQTTAYDPINETWGIALLQVQANIPNTIPGQNVIFVLMGGSSLQNAVAPEDAVLAQDGIAIVLSAGANIHSGSADTFSVIGGAQRGTELIADGLSENGAWLRVTWQETIGWVPRRLVEENPAIDELPTWEPQQRAPMQAFYLQTGIGSAPCSDAPTDSLLVQSPQNMEIDLTVNGVNIRIGSTILLKTTEQQTMEIAVLDGHATVLDENYEPTDTVIRTGQTSTVCLSEDGRTPNCDFSTPQPIDLGRYGTYICTYESVPANLLNYPIDLVCPGDPLPTDPIVEQSGSATPSELESVDCSTFELIGPFEGITPRFTTFEWTEALGATDYFVVFYDYNGREAGAYPTQETNLTLLMGDVPTGSELQWEVRAYADGEYACVTERTPVITRLADPEPPPSDPGDGGDLISWTCVNAYTMRITWNLPANSDSGSTITFNDYANGIFPATVSSSDLSGSITYSWTAPVAGGVEVDSGSLTYDPPGPNKGRTVNFGGVGLNCG